MLKPHEIFSKLPADVSERLFGFLHESEKPLYRTTIAKLAEQRKLRPVFLERKPRAERHAWLQEALGRKTNDAVAAHLLQIYLVGGNKDMLCDFLDHLGIAHDENGTVQELPPPPEKEKLAGAINILLEKYPPGVVKVYLHAFQALDETGWSSLGEILAEDARLHL